MKAAVLYHCGDTPRYEDFPDPTPGKDEVQVQVQAVVLDNALKAIAAGTHYASRQFISQLPAVVGISGIGMVEDGQLVGFGGMRPPYGALAEKAVVPRAACASIPSGVDAVTAAALPSSALSSLFPFKWGAMLQAGETVLVQGATGVSGRLAIQIAKLLGAGRVIGTGRNNASLQQLRELGADAVIDLTQSDESLVEAFRQEAGSTGFHVIPDFVWGHPTDVLINALVPHEISFAKQRIRFVQIGEAAGATISLRADALRTSGLEIIGAGANLSPESITEGANLVWEWIKEGKLQMDIERVPLREIASAWQRTDLSGKRLVIVP